MQEHEIIEIDQNTETICCDGGQDDLGHPAVYYTFNSQNKILATSGKRKYVFDIAKDSFAWISSNKVEKKMIKTMKKGSRIMVTGYNKSGSQTIDHYSLLGFTKAYNTAKKSCT